MSTETRETAPLGDILPLDCHRGDFSWGGGLCRDSAVERLRAFHAAPRAPIDTRRQDIHDVETRRAIARD